jgi:type IV pilus assembly protein PilZ
MAEDGENDSNKSVPPAGRRSIPPDGVAERRSNDRIPVAWPLDYQNGENFLYSYMTNISSMGLFVHSKSPLAVGTKIQLSFAPPNEELFILNGEVAWVNPWREGSDNPNPGMGVRFVDLSDEQRERLVALIHTIAYLLDQ